MATLPPVTGADPVGGSRGAAVGRPLGSGTRRRGFRRKRARWPWLLGVVLALGVAGWLAARYDRAPLPSGIPADVSPQPVPEAPPAPATARSDLPSLAESDPVVRDQARELSAQPAFDGWLSHTSLIRRFVAAIENVADGDSPRAHVAFLAPAGKFRARTERGRTVVDPASYARYDAVADVVASLDASACVRLYRALEPLLDAAYRELGRRDRTLAGVLSQSIARLTRVPVPDGTLELTPLVTVYQLADPSLESLSAAEKQLLRLGPRNMRLVQDKLREIDGLLHAPA